MIAAGGMAARLVVVDQAGAVMLHRLAEKGIKFGPTLHKAARIVQRIWRAHLTGFGGATRLGNRTGQLRRSVLYRMAGENEAIVGTASIYSKIHEYGGVIVPRRKRFLVFRVPHALTGKSGKGGWVFARRVVIPPRPHMRPALEDSAGPVRQLFLGDIKAALSSARTREFEIGQSDMEARAAMSEWAK